LSFISVAHLHSSWSKSAGTPRAFGCIRHRQRGCVPSGSRAAQTVSRPPAEARIIPKATPNSKGLDLPSPGTMSPVCLTVACSGRRSARSPQRLHVSPAHPG
jgi:hypothetical protein